MGVRLERRTEAESHLPLGFWFSVILFLAAGLRLFPLGQPLREEEAVRALGAWQLMLGQAPNFWDEPALAVGTGAAFFVLGDSDAVARLLPAAMGTAMVVLLWPMRSFLGFWGTLATGILTALSPTLVYYSRTLSSEAPVAAIGLFLFWRWLSFRKGRFSPLLIAAVPFSLLLQLGAAGVTMAMVMGLFFALYLAVGKGVSVSEGAEERAWSLTREQTGALAGFFLGTLLLVGTGFFLYPKGFGLPSVLAWVRQFDFPSGGYPWYVPWLRLLSYEPAALLFGCLGVLFFLRSYLRGRNPSPERLHYERFLVLWAVGGGMLIVLKGEGSSGEMVLLVTPLTLLGGSFLGEALSRTDESAWRRFGFLTALGVILLGVMVLAASRLSLGQGSPGSSLALIATSLALLVIFALWPANKDYHRVWPVATMLGFLPALAFTLHTTWNLNYGTGYEWFGLPIPYGETVEELAGLGRWEQYLGRAYDLTVDGALWRPLGWYFRDRTNVSFSRKLEPGPTSLVGMAALGDKKGIIGYSMSSLPYEASWRPEPLNLRGFWRWLIYREPFGDKPQETRIILYIKS